MLSEGIIAGHRDFLHKTLQVSWCDFSRFPISDVWVCSFYSLCWHWVSAGLQMCLLKTGCFADRILLTNFHRKSQHRFRCLEVDRLTAFRLGLTILVEPYAGAGVQITFILAAVRIMITRRFGNAVLNFGRSTGFQITLWVAKSSRLEKEHAVLPLLTDCSTHRLRKNGP